MLFDVVIYHSPCADGYTSAAIAKLKNPNAKFIGMGYASAIPNLKDKNVLICDYSFKKHIINDLLKVVRNLLIIDHHKTAEEDLKDLDPKYKIFDLNHCGAYLTWKYFFPDTDVPLFVKYIEDNDLWLKKLPNTIEVSSFVKRLEFEDFSQFLADDSLIEKVMIPEGKLLVEEENKEINFFLSKSTTKEITIDDEKFIVAVCTCSESKNISEVGNRMLTKHPEVNFSIVFHSAGASLRSEDSRSDVSVIAAKYGGGGHRNASGCRVRRIEDFK